MRKLTINCDCCGKEIEEIDVFALSHYIHVDPNFNRFGGHAKDIDGKMYSISGRMEKKEFCLPCYNELFRVFFNTIPILQK